MACRNLATSPCAQSRVASKRGFVLTLLYRTIFALTVCHNSASSGAILHGYLIYDCPEPCLRAPSYSFTQCFQHQNTTHASCQTYSGILWNTYSAYRRLTIGHISNGPHFKKKIKALKYVFMLRDVSQHNELYHSIHHCLNVGHRRYTFMSIYTSQVGWRPWKFY